MAPQEISERAFIDLTGQIGVELFRRHRNGSSWMLTDGRIALAIYRDDRWYYYVLADNE